MLYGLTAETKKCPCCKKKFFRLDYSDYAWKIQVRTSKASGYKYYCSYTCYMKAWRELHPDSTN